MRQAPEYQGQVHLQDALNMSQWYVEEGNVVPRNQNIIYSRNVLIFYVPRRAHTLNIGRLVGGPQAHFNRLPRTVAGFDRLNDTQVDFNLQESLHNGDHVYDLKSVVVVEVNQAIAGPQGQGSQLITGCSACIRRDANDPHEADRIYWYNPRAAAIGNMPPMEPTTGTQVWTNNPITYISESGGNDQEDFYTKASRRGTIFLYKQQGDSTLQQLIAY